MWEYLIQRENEKADSDTAKSEKTDYPSQQVAMDYINTLTAQLPALGYVAVSLHCI